MDENQNIKRKRVHSSINSQSEQDNNVKKPRISKNKKSSDLLSRAKGLQSRIAARLGKTSKPKPKPKMKILEKSIFDIELKESSMYDPRLGGGRKGGRKNRPLALYTPGELLRKEQDNIKKEKEILIKRAEKEKISSYRTLPHRILLYCPENENLNDNENNENEKVLIPKAPIIEWWDALLLKNPSNGYKNYELKENIITNTIQKPIPLDPPIADKIIAPRPLELTKKERRKLRTRKRQEKQLELQTKIKLGIIPPPPPKVRLSNLMRVLGEKHAKDPTKIEKAVREEVAARLKKHEDHIAAHKLTPEQRSAKNSRKYEEDTSSGKTVCVFRVRDLRDKKHMEIVKQNAGYYPLEGAAIVFSNINIVIVIGGPKGVSKFKRLMLNRIKWNEYITDSEIEDEEKLEEIRSIRNNVCKVVWEGTILESPFDGFFDIAFNAESAVRSFLGDRGIENYYDIARNCDLES